MTHVAIKVLTRNTVAHESIRTVVVKFDESLLSLEETFRNFLSSVTTLNYRDRIGTVSNFTEFNMYLSQV